MWRHFFKGSLICILIGVFFIHFVFYFYCCDCIQDTVCSLSSILRLLTSNRNTKITFAASLTAVTDLTASELSEWYRSSTWLVGWSMNWKGTKSGISCCSVFYLLMYVITLCDRKNGGELSSCLMLPDGFPPFTQWSLGLRCQEGLWAKTFLWGLSFIVKHV